MLAGKHIFQNEVEILSYSRLYNSNKLGIENLTEGTEKVLFELWIVRVVEVRIIGVFFYKGSRLKF